MPSFPLITGSSPLCKHTDATLNPALVLQYPAGPVNRFTLHSLGHKVQVSRINLSIGLYKFSYFMLPPEKKVASIYDIPVACKDRNVSSFSCYIFEAQA
jgi:hypothetical protein